MEDSIQALGSYFALYDNNGTKINIPFKLETEDDLLNHVDELLDNTIVVTDWGMVY